jgi:hypothetical protein
MGTKVRIWGGNWQDGARRLILGGLLDEKLVQNGAKWSTNRKQIGGKFNHVLEVGSGLVFVSVFFKNGIKIEPRDHQHRFKNGVLVKK